MNKEDLIKKACYFIDTIETVLPAVETGKPGESLPIYYYKAGYIPAEDTFQWGYNDGDWDFVSDMPPLDKSSYSFNFSTDGKYRPYRCKTWYKLEGKNHYVYNDDLNNEVLHQEVYSYLCNLVAQKGL